jgi:hypothetical protein
MRMRARIDDQVRHRVRHRIRGSRRQYNERWQRIELRLPSTHPAHMFLGIADSIVATRPGACTAAASETADATGFR